MVKGAESAPEIDFFDFLGTKEFVIIVIGITITLVAVILIVYKVKNKKRTKLNTRV